MTRKDPRPSLPPGGLGNIRPTETHVVMTPLAVLRKWPTFTLLSGVDAGKLFPLDQNETVIGRAHDAGVRIDDSGISRRHARVFRGPDGGFVIEDLGSTNGIFRNGERVDRSELAAGDKVQIGLNVIFRFSLIDASEEAQARHLFDLSTKDGLTGAFNRNYLTGRLTKEVTHAERDQTELGLIMFDVDHFKKTNDTYGHIAGDTVLQAVAAQVAKLIRSKDVFARYGGEEFVAILKGASHEDAVRFAERVRKGIEDLQIPFGSGTLTARVSVGVALLREVSEPAGGEGRGAELLALADKRLYQAKGAGRNRVVAA